MTLAEVLRARRQADDRTAATVLDARALARRGRRRLTARLAGWATAIAAVGMLGSVTVEAALATPAVAGALRLEAAPGEVAVGGSGAVVVWLQAGGDGGCAAAEGAVVEVVVAAQPAVLELGDGRVSLAGCGRERGESVAFTAEPAQVALPVQVTVSAQASGGVAGARLDAGEPVTVEVVDVPPPQVSLDG